MAVARIWRNVTDDDDDDDDEDDFQFRRACPTTLMRLLLDTNVVVSGLLWRGAAYALLVTLRDRPDVRLFTSAVLVDELARVLTRPSAAKQLALIGKSAQDIVADYLEAVTCIDEVEPMGAPPEQAVPVPPRFVPRDADDDHVVAAALAAGVEAIVTGDSDLLSVGGFGEIKVLTVAALRERLAAASSSS